MILTFRWHTFGELGGTALYEILSLRQRVFVVEQRCAYQDADGLDSACFHLCGRTEEGTLEAYLRLVPPGAKFAGPSIGRVITAPEIRGGGAGRRLMEEGIRGASERYPSSPLTVSAQLRLQRFYASLEFTASGPPFDEDGIPHIVMVRPRDGVR